MRWIIAVLAAAASLAGSPLLAADEKLLSIGAVLPLSGEFSYVGKELQRGIELARKKYADIKVTYEDDQSLQTAAAVRGANKLLQIDKVDILLTASIDNVHAVAPLLERAARPGIVIWDSAREAAAINPWVFTMGFSADLAGRDMADFARKTLRAGRAAVIGAEGEWSERISAGFVAQFAAGGGLILLHERVNPNDTDFRSLILRVAQTGAEVIYIPLYYASLSSFIRQTRELGLSVPLLSGDGLTPDDLLNLRGRTQDLYFTYPWLQSDSFNLAYEAQHEKPDSPIRPALAALGFDAVALIAEKVAALRMCNAAMTPKALRDELQRGEYQGVYGAISFAQGRYAPRKEKILRIVNSELTPIEERSVKRVTTQ